MRIPLDGPRQRLAWAKRKMEEVHALIKESIDGSSPQFG